MAAILEANEQDVVKTHNSHLTAGTRPAFVLICEHASNFIPPVLNSLGVDAATMNSHAGYDLGALALAKLMMKKLKSPLVAQQVSRLVYDCNRPPLEPSAMPVKCEIYPIAGNVNLSQAQRDERIQNYYMPFNRQCKSVISNEIDNNNQPIIVTIHSFTGNFLGKIRTTEIGLLHDVDSRFTDVMLDLAKNDPDYEYERNKPYGPEDGVTHSLKEYALPHGLHNVMIEVRNDLLTDSVAQEKIADNLVNYLLASKDKI